MPRLVPRTESAAAKQCSHRFGKEDGSVVVLLFGANRVLIFTMVRCSATGCVNYSDKSPDGEYGAEQHN